MSKAFIFLIPPILLLLMIGYVEMRRSPAATAPPAEASVDLGPIERSVAALVDRVGELEREVAELKSRPATPVGAVAPPAEASEDPGGKAPVAAGPNRRAEKVRAFLARIRAGPVSEEEISSLWDYLSGSGLEKEVVAEFQKYVKDHPKDPDAWYGLGTALTNRFLAGNVSQAEIAGLSMQADQAFDKALGLDDHHFGARYSKAVSYTFWPSFLGKGPEAIKNFETLVEQQGGDSTNKMMESVYLNLGNEYLKMANAKKAREAFESGLRVFSDSEEIRNALEAMEK